jgi:hypothetical protein
MEDMKTSQTSASELRVPAFVSTEQAMAWGARLNREERAALLQRQRALSKIALATNDLQRMVDLATQAQLMREAAEAVPSF